MASSENFRQDKKKKIQEENDSDLPQGFLAAMRFNALQRGMKWRDTYKLSAELSGE